MLVGGLPAMPISHFADDRLLRGRQSSPNATEGCRIVVGVALLLAGFGFAILAVAALHRRTSTQTQD